MKSNPPAIFVLPTGQKYPPVSVGELPSHKYQVSIETITEDVSSHLEAHPEIPGVILVRDDKIHSMIPRTKMFERLGHRPDGRDYATVEMKPVALRRKLPTVQRS